MNVGKFAQFAVQCLKEYLIHSVNLSLINHQLVQRQEAVTESAPAADIKSTKIYLQQNTLRLESGKQMTMNAGWFVRFAVK